MNGMQASFRFRHLFGKVTTSWSHCSHSVWKSLPKGKRRTLEASPPLPPQGAGYLPIRFLHSLGNGPIAIVPLPSFRWEMKRAGEPVRVPPFFSNAEAIGFAA